MSSHEHDPLLTAVIVVRAWGQDRLQAAIADVAAQFADGAVNINPGEGVLVEIDPGGGGGPYNTVILRNFQFRMDGVGLPGYPGDD